MQRPVMDVTYLEDGPTVKRPIRNFFAAIFGFVWRIIRMFFRGLFYNPLSSLRSGSRFRNEIGSPLSRFMRGFAYRLAFVPILAALFCCALVYSATHSLAPQFGGTGGPTMDPSSQGVYYDPVTVLTEDGVRLESWLVPAIDARSVIDNGAKILRDKYPAAVLVHNFGFTRQQMLPLVKPLHDVGFVVLVMGLRGDDGTQQVGRAFGLRESADVKAAVELLRRRPFVDPDRITLVGIGSGANAAMLHAATDGRIAAMVLDDPINGIDEIVDERLIRNKKWLHWARPLCKWTFEIGYEVDGEELNLSRHSDLLSNRHVLMLDGTAAIKDFALDPGRVQQVKQFLMNAVAERSLRGLRAEPTLPKVTSTDSQD
jgi:hypothetical protein